MRKVCISNTRLSFVPFRLEIFNNIEEELKDMKQFMPYKSLRFYSEDNGIPSRNRYAGSKYIWILVKEDRVNEPHKLDEFEYDFLLTALHSANIYWKKKSFNSTYLIESILIGLGDKGLYEEWKKRFGVSSKDIQPMPVFMPYVPEKLDRWFTSEKYSIYRLTKDIVESGASLIVDWNSYNSISVESTELVLRDPQMTKLRIVGNQSLPNISLAGENKFTIIKISEPKEITNTDLATINLVNCGNLNTEQLTLCNCPRKLIAKFKRTGILVKVNGEKCTIDLTKIPVYSKKDRKRLDFNYLTFILEDILVLNKRILIKKREEPKKKEENVNFEVSHRSIKNKNEELCTYKLHIIKPSLTNLDGIDKYSDLNLEQLEKEKKKKTVLLRDFIFRLYLQEDEEFEKRLYSYIGNKTLRFTLKYSKIS